MDLHEKALRPAMLKGLVDNTVDIDLHTPKIQKDSVVVVMRVKQNYDAAYDLSSFLEKLPYGILDTEAQEVPTSDGMYEIFMEFERDENFPSNMMKTLDATTKLGEELHFKGLMYGVDDAQEITIDTLASNVRLVPEKNLKEFMEYACSSVLLEDNGESRLQLHSSTYHHSAAYTNVMQVTEAETTEIMKEGWEFASMDQHALFGNQYDVLRTNYGLLAMRRDGSGNIMFI